MSLGNLVIPYQELTNNAAITSFASEIFGNVEENNRRALMYLYKTNPKKYLEILKIAEEAIQTAVNEVVTKKYNALKAIKSFKEDGTESNNVALSETTRRNLALMAGKDEQKIQIAILNARFPINNFSGAAGKIQSTISG